MDLKTLVKLFVDESDLEAAAKRRATEKSKAEKRIVVIEKMIAKMYADNINGLIDDVQLNNVIASLNQETASLQELLKRIEADSQPDNTAVRFRQFFQMAKQYATIDVLDREALLTFVERIEVGPKILPEGTQMTSHRNQPFRQSVRIVYKFIGDIARDTVYQFPKTC